MKILLLLCITLHGCGILAQVLPSFPPQIVPTDKPTVYTKCFSGPIAPGIATKEVKRVPCDFTKGFACQTKIEEKLGFISINRQCVQRQSCITNARLFSSKCNSRRNFIRQCFFCCTTSLCNDFTTIP